MALVPLNLDQSGSLILGEREGVSRNSRAMNKSSR